MGKPKILIIDDDPAIVDIVKTNLEADGYDVIATDNGADGVQLARSEEPDLVLLDLNLPGTSGYDTCCKLRGQLSTSHLPIIMLTAAASTHDKIAGMRSGADDYVTKPFDALELVARVEMNLHRAIRNRDLNPLTGLPGNRAIESVLENRIVSGQEFAALYADLDHFKSYNDAYGFTRGDEVIKFTSRCLLNAVTKLGQPDDFVGHIGGDDFLVVTRPVAAEAICKAIIAEFDAGIGELYDEEDRNRGYIVMADRQGAIHHTPLVSISIGIISNAQRKLRHVAELSHIAADLKAYVKGLPGSNYAFDRRSSGGNGGSSSSPPHQHGSARRPRRR